MDDVGPALQLGVFLPTMTAPGESPRDITADARLAEAVGLESVWAVDQLVAGTGAPFLDSVVALTAAAAVTDHIRIGFGVMIVPLRPPAWIAKQLASLQVLSDHRVLFGAGAGGDRHDRSWDAVGVPRRERGRRTDETLAVLPSLVAGEVATLAGGAAVQLAPGAPMPPVLIGGMSDAALRRTIEHDAGWFLLPVPPDAVADAHRRAAAAAVERGRATPTLTTGLLIALDDDPDLPDDATVRARLTDPDGVFGMPPEAVDEMLVRGSTADVATRLRALRAAGADRVVASIAAGDWARQTALFAEAGALAAGDRS
jgi:alkanesulfonate monooxygenase SsuD/methylene tetrahydromethanopterin reductase-like flavin-dependent oxidoreductase (luciferase family)